MPFLTETLRNALAWRQELDSSAVATRADICRREGLARTPLTQALLLVSLALETSTGY